MSTDYNKQATDFLERNRIKFRATLADSKLPPWDDPLDGVGKLGDGGKASPMDNDKPRHHYRVTLSRRKGYAPKGSGKVYADNPRLTFDFWGSIADAEKGVTDVSAYDVLSCISGDSNSRTSPFHRHFQPQE